jgi:hypothetical protein
MFLDFMSIFGLSSRARMNPKTYTRAQVNAFVVQDDSLRKPEASDPRVDAEVRASLKAAGVIAYEPGARSGMTGQRFFVFAPSGRDYVPACVDVRKSNWGSIEIEPVDGLRPSPTDGSDIAFYRECARAPVGVGSHGMRLPASAHKPLSAGARARLLAHFSSK